MTSTAANDHVAVVVDEAGKRLEQCRLAGPVRADDRDQVAGFDTERGVLERVGLTVVRDRVPTRLSRTAESGRNATHVVAHDRGVCCAVGEALT